MRRTLVMITVLAAASACGDDFAGESEPEPVEPADFAGTYAVNFTNKDNGCMLENWVEGETSNGVPITIEQDGAAVTATVDGLAGSLLNLWIGSNRLSGTVEGDEATLTLLGDKRTTDPCEWILDATYAVTLAGDAISGEATYVREAVGGSCAFPQPCESHQKLSGSRPPK